MQAATTIAKHNLAVADSDAETEEATRMTGAVLDAFAACWTSEDDGLVLESGVDSAALEALEWRRGTGAAARRRGFLLEHPVGVGMRKEVKRDGVRMYPYNG